MSKILGIDYGLRRIGVAVADEEVRIAMPLTVLTGRNDPTRDARMVTDLAVREAAVCFVVGLPLCMEREESTRSDSTTAPSMDNAQTRVCRLFAAELQRLSGRPVHFQDEHLTSYGAGELAAQHGKRKKKAGAQDALAAQLILQTWLDQPRA